MVALPTPGADSGVWGTELNAWLLVTRNADGSTKLTAADVGADAAGAAAAAQTAAEAYTDAHAPLLQPWQFRPEDYGALGDGIICTVDTTAASATIVASSAVFTSTAVDGGKPIMIHGADGATNGPLITTIATVTDSTHAVLAAAPSATVSACPAVFGTDDQAAIQACLDAAGAYGIAHDYLCEILFGAKIYMIAGAAAQTGDALTTPSFYAQLRLPYPAADGTSRKLVVQLTGPGDAGSTEFWMSHTPHAAGAVLMSTLIGPGALDPTYGLPSVIGGPALQAGFTAGGTTAFANTKVVVKGVQISTPIFTHCCAFDFSLITQARVQQSSAHTFAPTGFNGGVQPYLKDHVTDFGNGISVAWKMPQNQNNDDCVMDDVTAEGYGCGYYLYDHLDAGRLTAIYVGVGARLNSGGGIGHLISVRNFSIEAYVGGLLTNSNVGGGAMCAVDINMSCEASGPVYDLNDPGSYLFGRITWEDPADPRMPIVLNGGKNVKLINNMLGPGVWSGQQAVPGSQPAVPASTVAQQNTAYRDAAVTISGGTVTDIAVDGQSTGLTSGTVIVPSGKTITLTYSVAPSWLWVLL